MWSVSVIEILKRFAEMSESDQAWVMVTLLDFKAEHEEEFTRTHGTYAQGIIARLLE